VPFRTDPFSERDTIPSTPPVKVCANQGYGSAIHA
jgi:hypothetical protein